MHTYTLDLECIRQKIFIPKLNKAVAITSFVVFHLLSFNLRYVSLFELFIANNGTARCMIFQKFT